MGIKEKLRSSRAMRKVKADLKKNLKDKQWADDYNKAYNKLNGNPAPKKESNHLNGGGSGGEKWPYGMSSTNQDFYLDHFQLRSNARRAMQDVPMARSMVERLHTSIVGRGLRAQFMPKAEILGITPEEAEEWGAKVSDLIDTWADSKKSHRAQTMNFYQAQSLYGMWMHRDGDMFTRLFYSSRRDLLSPLQFEFLDPNQIGGYSYTSSNCEHAYKSNADGITKNADGTERSYKVYITTEKGIPEEKEIPRIGPKSGRVFMLHGFKPEFAGQTRGFSPLAHALQEFENSQDFALSMIKKAINQSQLVLSVENQQQAAGSAGLEGITGARGFAVNGTTEDPQEIGDTGCRFEPKPLNEALFSTPGSTILTENNQGDTVKMLENKTPSESFKDFITPFFSFISSSLNIPLEIVLMEFNKSYSASRAAIVLFHRIVVMWRDEIKADLIKPTLEMLLSEWIAAGKIAAPGWQDPFLKEAWLNFMLIGSPIPSIDPQKEAMGNMLNIEMGADNQKSVARAYNGSSARDNIAINKRLFAETPTPPWKGGEQPENDNQKEEKGKEEGDE